LHESSETLRIVYQSVILFTASKFGIVHKFQKEARKEHQQNRLTLDTMGVRAGLLNNDSL